MSWPLFLALLNRVARYEARAKLRELDAALAGASAAWGGGRELRGEMDRLHRLAYPTKRRAPRFAVIQSTDEDDHGE